MESRCGFGKPHKWWDYQLEPPEEVTDAVSGHGVVHRNRWKSAYLKKKT